MGHQEVHRTVPGRDHLEARKEEPAQQYTQFLELRIHFFSSMSQPRPSCRGLSNQITMKDKTDNTDETLQNGYTAINVILFLCGVMLLLFFSALCGEMEQAPSDSIQYEEPIYTQPAQPYDPYNHSAPL